MDIVVNNNEPLMFQIYSDGCPDGGPSQWTSLVHLLPAAANTARSSTAFAGDSRARCYPARQAGMADSGWTHIQKCYFAAMEYKDCMGVTENDEHVLYQMYNRHCPENGNARESMSLSSALPAVAAVAARSATESAHTAQSIAATSGVLSFAHRAGTDDDSWNPTQVCWYAATEYENCKGLSSSNEEEMYQKLQRRLPH